MTKARLLANYISDGSPLADGAVDVSEVSGAAPLANPTFTGTASGTFSGPLTGDVAGELDLSPIASTIADTAVDVFVYDTSKDSDGGAWRKRTQGTSWYNETLNTATRGSRKEFPSVAVIVAESDTVTIYDGDDPSLPMWMVFNGGNNFLFRYAGATAISMVNSRLCICNNAGSVGGLTLADFSKDHGEHHNDVSGEVRFYDIVSRHVSISGGEYTGSKFVTSHDWMLDVTNDVAMTVLPNAPIDAATGLPVPTIAVATDGGVSVIKDDGTVVDIVHTDGTTTPRIWLRDNLVIYNAASFLHARTIPSEDVSAGLRYVANSKDTWFAPRFDASIYPGGSFQLHPTGANPDQVLQWDNSVAITNQDRLNRAIVSDVYGENNALANFTTSTYNTGWMNGDIKLATLSDTDDTDVTGSELVTNGTFDSDTSGWTNKEGDGTFTSSSSQGVLTYGTGATAFQQDVSVTIGKTYTIVVEYAGGTSTIAQAYYRDSTDVGLGTITEPTPTTLTKTVTATTSSIKVFVRVASSGTAIFDNISVRLAEEDRSVNGNGLQVFGTVTKNPVATGADLVAYSGFYTNNYLEQPYNSDLDFGTGDFCVMGWVKNTTDGNDYFLSRTIKADGTNPRWGIRASSDNTIGFNINGQIVSDTGISTGANWQHVVFTRRNSVIEGYVDGVLKVTTANTNNLTNASAQIFIGGWGTSLDSSNLSFGGSLALWRISATAPSPEQIAKIYEDEKVLFQENAQATLYGSSDAVTALAYDDSTELLHVGTSAGRSDFQGLRRVNNTTNAVGAAISASGGMIVEE